MNVEDLSAEFLADFMKICMKEAHRKVGTQVFTPDAITGLDQGKSVYIDLISTDTVMVLKQGWYASQAGITGRMEASPRYFDEALTFIPWTNISNTRDR